MAFRVVTTFAAAAIAGLALGGIASTAQAQPARVGLLSCAVSSGNGMVITSSRALDCTFQADTGMPPEHYLGTVTRFGLDVGYTGPGRLSWGVLAPSAAIGPGALQGTYSGVGGGATIGIGLTGNLLAGGSGQTTSLQPLSVSGQTGLNLTAGVGQIMLEYVPPPPPMMRRKRMRRHRRA